MPNRARNSGDGKSCGVTKAHSLCSGLSDVVFDLRLVRDGHARDQRPRRSLLLPLPLPLLCLYVPVAVGSSSRKAHICIWSCQVKHLMPWALLQTGPGASSDSQQEVEGERDRVGERERGRERKREEGSAGSHCKIYLIHTHGALCAYTHALTHKHIHPNSYIHVHTRKSTYAYTEYLHTPVHSLTHTLYSPKHTMNAKYSEQAHNETYVLTHTHTHFCLHCIHKDTG